MAPKGLGLGAAGLLVSVLVSLLPQGAMADPSVPACGRWHIVNSPSPSSTGEDVLNSVSVLSASDVWAAGSSNRGGKYRVLVVHWDGSRWTVSRAPNPSGEDNIITGVATVSSNDAWAVGYESEQGNDQTLTEHWDGAAWSVVRSHRQPTGFDSQFLEAVGADGTSDVWAVGESFRMDDHFYSPLAEHWNGTHWETVAIPSVVGSISDFVRGVAVVSPRDVWAVGSWTDVDDRGHALIEHWDGTAWSVVSTPEGTAADSFLAGVTAVSSTDVWAAGFTTVPNETLVEHWDGSAWTIVPSPNGPGTSSSLAGVSARSATDVWGAGQYIDGFAFPLFEHWDGVSWSVVPGAIHAQANHQLRGIDAVTSGDVWAVGTVHDGGATLTEHLVEC